MPDVPGAPLNPSADDDPQSGRTDVPSGDLRRDQTETPLWTSRYCAAERPYTMVQSSFQPAEALRLLGNAMRSHCNSDITLRLTRTQYDRLKRQR